MQHTQQLPKHGVSFALFPTWTMLKGKMSVGPRTPRSSVVFHVNPATSARGTRASSEQPRGPQAPREPHLCLSSAVFPETRGAASQATLPRPRPTTLASACLLHTTPLSQPPHWIPAPQQGSDSAPRPASCLVTGCSWTEEMQQRPVPLG